MNSFTTFKIPYYLLIGVSLIILYATTRHKDTDHQILKTSYVASPEDSNKRIKPVRFAHTDIEFEVADVEAKTYLFNTEQEKSPAVFEKPDFWTTLHSVESKQGRLLYRPSNKNRNCDTTSSPCGHHQLSLQALKDISCITKQCKRDRENFQKSLTMSKQLQAINDKRLKKAGYTNLPEYQQYLIHQQGASGLKRIIASSKGKKQLSKILKKNMAGNSPYSYRTLRRMGSKLAAKKFLQHWKKKWQKEKILIRNVQQKPEVIAAVQSTKPSSLKRDPAIIIPLFNDQELKIALNMNMQTN